MLNPCPHCGADPVRLHAAGEHNVLTYGVTSLVRTDCCGKPVHARRVQALRVQKYEGSDKADDWGRRFDGKKRSEKDPI